jgi:hypothetical protein
MTESQADHIWTAKQQNQLQVGIPAVTVAIFEQHHQGSMWIGFLKHHNSLTIWNGHPFLTPMHLHRAKHLQPIIAKHYIKMPKQNDFKIRGELIALNLPLGMRQLCSTTNSLTIGYLHP